MLIDVIIKARKQGLLGRDVPGTLSFCSNNNLAVRKQALETLAGYDEAMETCEDIDLCARILRSPWKLFLCQSMQVMHEPRTTVMALLAQWWGYGRFVPYIFNKHSHKCWEIFLARSQNSKGRDNPYRLLLYKKSMPFTMGIFITPFLLMHLTWLASLVCAIEGCVGGTIVCLLASAIQTCLYFEPDVRATGMNLSTIKLAALRYAVNCVYFASHIWHGLAAGIIYVPPVIAQTS